MSDQVDLVPAAEGASITPTVPRGVEESEQTELRDRAKSMITELQERPDDRQLARGLASLGSDAEIRATQEIDLLKTKVGTLLNDLDGPGSKIPEGLLKLPVAHALGPPQHAEGLGLLAVGADPCAASRPCPPARRHPRQASWAPMHGRRLRLANRFANERSITIQFSTLYAAI